MPGELALLNTNLIDASSAGDRVGTTAASDCVVVCAPRDGEALGLTRERDGDPGTAVAAEIASTPWIEAFVAPRLLRSAEVEVRLMVSVPAPRLIVPAPIMIASSCAPVSVIVHCHWCR